MFKGRAGGSLRQLFPDSLQEIYVSISLNDTANDNITPDDYYTTIPEATEASRNNHGVEIDHK
jgi:hypothetical protein